MKASSTKHPPETTTPSRDPGRRAAFERHPVPTGDDAVRGLRTVRDLVRWACSRLEASGSTCAQGTDNPRDEAFWLVLWALRLPLDDPEPFLDARVLPAERRDVIALIDRRCDEHLPSAYLTGEAWLRGLRLRADPRALIPRSLLVEALEEALDPWLPATPPGAILDLCTGGGSIAIAAALRFEHARVDATDLSHEALTLAGENIALHDLGARIALHHGDLFAGLEGRRYDLILSNPPYVNADSMARLPAEFRHEPENALAGGSDGMDIVRRIVADARPHLAPDGLLVIEIGHEAPHFETAFPDLAFAWVPVSAGEQQIVAIAASSLPAARTRKPRPQGAR
jgi:ribosomal protein L3 glutamine methyltransferase